MTWPRPAPSPGAAAAGELEAIQIHEKPTDVLANQIVGLELDFGEISLERAHQNHHQSLSLPGPAPWMS